MKFEITAVQEARVLEWLHGEVYPRIVAEQKQDPQLARFIFTGSNGVEYPYFGAIGGSVTYAFTPTGLGVVTQATCCAGTAWETTLDLTEYAEW